MEKDRGLHEYLVEQFSGHPGLNLIAGDALDLDAAFFEGEGISKVVSNLPYSVGSRFLMNVFALPRPPQHITVTVQLEVAERLGAGPGAEERGLLGVWAQRRYQAETVKVISSTCFFPRPAVKSAVVVMKRLPGSDFQSGNGKLFGELTKEAFAFRRKQMATIMARLAGRFSLTPEHAVSLLSETGLDPRIRPEMLTVDQWQALADGIARKRGM